MTQKRGDVSFTAPGGIHHREEASRCRVNHEKGGMGVGKARVKQQTIGINMNRFTFQLCFFYVDIQYFQQTWNHVFLTCLG